MEVTQPCQEYDFEYDRAINTLIQELESLFKAHYILFESTLEVQKKIIDEMWVISQRFLILTRGGLCTRPYPPEPYKREQREITTAFYEVKERLEDSSHKLTASLYKLKEKCSVFDRGMRKVDASIPNPIVEGNAERKPIYHYIEFFSDLFRFLHDTQNKLNFLGRFITIEDIGAIMEYKHLLETDKVVNDYFEKSLNIDNKS